MDTKKLRQKILDLAIHGKLVPQDPNDEPASVLLERIRAEKERLIAEGKIKRSKKSATSDTPHYENVPFEVPEGWCWCRLDCVGEIVTGSTPSKDNVDYYGGSIPFYKPTDLEQGINTIEASDSLTELGFSVSRQLPGQSILVTCIGATIGKTGLIQKRGTCNQQINAIISNNMVLPEYLYYTCISGYMQSEIIGRASATTLPILNKNKFSEIPIPVPPIQEQQRIISKIETLFSFVIELGNSEKELISTISKAKLKILDLAIHGKLVPQDPNDEPASELLKRINPKAVTSCDNPHYEQIPFEIPDNWAWVRIDAINQFKSKTVNPQNYHSDQFELYSVPTFETGEPEFPYGKNIASSKVEVEEGDVLLCKINPHLNRVWVVRRRMSQLKLLASSEWIVIRTDEILPEYLALTMQSPYFRELMMSNVSGVGGSLMRAQPTFVKQYMIPIPPYNEQIRIVDKIQETFKTLDSIAESLN